MLHKIKLKKYKVLFLALLVHAVSYVGAFAQGPGNAIDFQGTSSFEHVNLGLGLSDSLSTASFTIEMWVKIESTSSDPAFMGNKDWSSGSNTGFLLCRRNASEYRFNFRPAGGTRVDYNVSVSNGIAGWNHLAMVVDRNGDLTAYLNGEQVGTPVDISTDAGKALHGTLPLRIGSDGTGTYSKYFDGKMDEVRIWKATRTAAQIRQYMCRKLTGSETDLYAYYNMEGNSTTTLSNMATATGTTFDGTLQNSPTRVKSGAAIGDTSVYVYTTSWGSQSLQLATANRGSITIDSFSGTGGYMQLYRIIDTPDLKGGLTPSNNNDVYYGIVASGSLVSYPKYNYSNYDSAKAYKEAVSFFCRSFDDVNNWSLKGAIYNDTTNHIIRTDSINGTRQLFLANFVGTCSTPTQQSVSDITYNSAKLSWSTGGSASWNIEYGPANFTQGNGTTVKNIISKPYVLNSLQPNTAYQFYVQDSCTGLGTSSWSGPYNFTTDPLPTYHKVGAGAAMKITDKGWIDATGNGGAKDTFTAVNLPVKDMTVEVWVKPSKFEQWRAMVGFLQDNGSFERGWDLETGNNNKFRFALSSQKTLKLNYMESTHSFDENQWYHVAGVYDGDTMKLYVNGILEATSTSDSGNIAYDNSWLSLGMYKDDNENISLFGSIDEVRIWNIERTQEDIRNTMCRRLKGNETGLVKYFRLDSYEGDTAYEMVAGAHGKLNGLADSSWIVSGAAIGDTSVYVYGSGLVSANLELNTGNRGKVNVDSIMANAEGVQVYLVNDTPHYQAGIADLGNTNKYLGVFTARNYTAKYRVRYDYTNYTDAVNNKSNLHLYNRRNNEYLMWAITNAGNNATTNTLSGNSHLGTRQYLLADFVALACSVPDSLQASNIDTGSATLKWVSQENRYSLQWGEVGFQLGSGISVSGLTTKSFGVTGLSLGTSYEAYVKNDCGGTESAWVGPMYFETVNPCMVQTNGFADSINALSAILKWTDPGAAPAYDISWGPKGFGNPNFGIQVTINGARYPLSGLQPVTEYDFYVRSNCGANKPAWAGPFTFKTDMVNTTAISSISTNDVYVVVYPNPATSTINIDMNVDGAHVSMFNAMGVKVYESVSNNKKVSIDVANKPSGMYYIMVAHNGVTTTRKVVVRH